MSVRIPLESIKRVYQFPDKTPRKIKIYLPDLPLTAILACMVAFVHFEIIPKITEGAIYLMLIIGAVIFPFALVIILVERAEKKKALIATTVVEGMPGVEFHLEGVSIEVTTGVECNTHTFLVADIKSISGYVQDGWLWVRERGVVIETNDNGQFRIVLDFSKSRFKLFADAFNLSLGEINYPSKKTRFFQV